MDNASGRKRSLSTFVIDDDDSMSYDSDRDDVVTEMEARRRKNWEGIKAQKRDVKTEVYCAEVTREIKSTREKMSTKNHHLKNALDG